VFLGEFGTNAPVMVVAHIPIIFIDAVQMAIELIITVIFNAAYSVPPDNTNPLTVRRSLFFPPSLTWGAEH